MLCKQYLQFLAFIGTARCQVILLGRVNREVTRTSSDTAALTPQLFGAIASGDQTLDMEHIDTGITGTLTEIIREGQAAGEFNKQWQPEVVAVSLAATWIMLPLAMRSPDFPDDPHQELLKLTLAGLGA